MPEKWQTIATSYCKISDICRARTKI